MEYKLFGARTPKESQREKENRALAEKAAAEGMVLLKNQGVLPIRERHIALYGAGARMTIGGGTGSGDTNERYRVSIEEGLKNVGYEIPNVRWLDRFDQDYEAHKQAWKDGIEEKIAGYKMETVMEMFEVIQSIPLQFPIGEKIRAEELAGRTSANSVQNTYTVRTAIYVVARQAGEGRDRKVESGDFLLTDTEIYNIRLLAETYSKFLLVINCGGMIDLSPLEKIPNIGAIFYYGQGGMEGGNAFARLVKGEQSPCGKLTDTWAMTYEDYPSASTFSHCNGDLWQEDYEEGIYVGYRYFDTFLKKPRYEFGFGLSYTEFDWSMNCHTNHEKGWKVSGSKIWMKVTVKNIGNEFSGKEVMQLYVAKPKGRLHHEVKGLAAFAKTPLLEPGESTELELAFDMREQASYDDGQGAWILEPGEYGVYLGNSSSNVTRVMTVSLEKEVVVEKTEHICESRREFQEWEKQETILPLDEISADLPRVELNASDFVCIEHNYDKPSMEEFYKDSRIGQLLSELSVEEAASLCVGGGQFGPSYNRTPGCVGRTTVELLEKGIPNINFSDGPAGLNLQAKTVVEADGTEKFMDALPESKRWGFLREMEPYCLGDPNQGTAIYQYMTGWPAIHVQAQTWDVALEEEIGRAIGVEMIEAGVTLWLAPALNIHRNPLCGRNFEYYSEDPLLSGKMAAAVTKGVQSHDGIGVTIKHFCCNNQEDNRNYVSENVSERALREVYLRGFRYVVEEASPWAVMSSYNKVNQVYTANSYDLLTKVLRKEWGFQGLVMTDWGATGGDKASYVECPKAGNDLIMPGSKEAAKCLVKAVSLGELDENDLRMCAGRVLRTVLGSRVLKEVEN